jgi:hypothetical protein
LFFSDIFNPRARVIFLLVAILQAMPLSMRSRVTGDIPALRAHSDLLIILASRSRFT